MRQTSVTFVLFLSAILLQWGFVNVADLADKRGSIAYLLVQGALLGGALYLFKLSEDSKPMRRIAPYKDALARLGVFAFVITLLGLASLLLR